MDILDLCIGVLMGVAGSGAVMYGRYKLKRRKATSVKLVSAPTNYDTRIDEITDNGLMRYKLHKAMNDPTAREALKGTPLYGQAASALGWD